MSDNTEVSDFEIQFALRQEEDRKKGISAVNTITGACNYGAGKEVAQGMIDALAHEHRTLQQDFWRVIREVAEKYADFPHDLRNEDAVGMCGEIKKIEHYLPRY
jgi:hypothetical protein